MSKKAARRRGPHVHYWCDLQGNLVDYNPKSQQGMPYYMRYSEWEAKHQDKLYLVEDKNWKKPPVVRPSKEMLEKARKVVRDTDREHAAKKKKEEAEAKKAVSNELTEKSKKALAEVIRAVTRWEVTGTQADLVEAKQRAKFTIELFPELGQNILQEFERATEERQKEASTASAPPQEDASG